MRQEITDRIIMTVILFSIFFFLGKKRVFGQDDVAVGETIVLRVNAESIRTAQAAVLTRILREADKGDPQDLLKLSQTLSTLQAAEGQQDALMVARAIEPQLEHLPVLVQTIQQQVLAQNVGNMLNEFRRHDEEMLPLMRGVIQVWGESLNMGAKVQQDIRDADELAEAEQAMADIQADDAARNIASTYEWKYVGSQDSDRVYQFTRRDGKAMDARRDEAILTYFDQGRWEEVEGQYMLSEREAKDLDKGGVLLSFSHWDWHACESKEKMEKLERVAGPRRAQLISK